MWWLKMTKKKFIHSYFGGQKAESKMSGSHTSSAGSSSFRFLQQFEALFGFQLLCSILCLSLHMAIIPLSLLHPNPPLLSSALALSPPAAAMDPRAARTPALRLLALGALLWPAARAWELTILHTNDVHSRLEQTSEDSSKCVNASRCVGGVARLATKVHQIRRAEPHVLLLDAGDQYQGTIWFTVYKGTEVAHFMNALRYDAMALGNHEFDNGVEGLIDPLLKKVNFSILSANIKAKGPLASKISGLYSPYKILPVGNEVVGIVGYTSKETPFLSNPGMNLVFEDEIAALQPEVDKLKTLNVNKIIALGHSGFEVDKLIAQKVKGVDVVVGGHSNTFLYTGNPPSKEVPAGQYPFIVTSDDGRKVPVVQAYAFGKYLGYLKVEFDEKGNVVTSHGNPILLNSSIPEDPNIKADINKWRVKLDNYSTQELGKTIVYLDGTAQSCRFRECNMGNLICDAMINNNLRHPDEMSWNHVSMCILNGGGIRSPIDERNNGTITWENLAAVLPFGGTFDLIQLKGSTLKKAFEHSVYRYGQATGEFLQVGGIHVVYDISRNPGDRVVKLEVLCTQCRVPSYEPLRMDKVYKVILPSFLVSGGDGFRMIKDEMIKHDSGDQDINVVSGYISKMKVLYPAVEGRIQFSAGSHCCESFSLIFLSVLAVIIILYQ